MRIAQCIPYGLHLKLNAVFGFGRLIGLLEEADEFGVGVRRKQGDEVDVIIVVELYLKGQSIVEVYLRVASIAEL